MAITRGQLLKELVPGLNAIFGTEYSRYEDEAAVLFDQESSNRAFEEEVLFPGFGEAQTKFEGAGVAYAQTGEGWVARYTNETVALAFAITEEAMEDNLYDKLSTRLTKALARSMSAAKQTKGAKIYNEAFTTSNGGDGQPLVSNSHPLQNGGTALAANDIIEAIAVPANTLILHAGFKVQTERDSLGLVIAANRSFSGF